MAKYLTFCCFGLLILVAISSRPVWSVTDVEPGNIQAEGPPRHVVTPAFDNDLSYQSCGDRQVARHRVMDRIVNLINQYGLLAIFGLLMFGIAGLPVPDELILTFAGYLIFQGVLQPLPTVVISCLGSVCGISLSYFLGFAVGIPLVEKYGQVIHLNVDKINLVHDWFNRIGKWTLMIGYFIPGVRHVTGFVAGVSQLEILVFARYAYAGAFFWSLTFISTGFFLGKHWCKIRSHLYVISLLGIILILAIILGYAVMAKQQQRRKDGYQV